jgi:RNA polymerase sigma-70 factor, ECF subfamily
MDLTRGDVDNLLTSRAADDPIIIETMVRDYRAPIYRLALSILRDANDAEDAVQDTFVRASLALNRYQVGTNFKSWLYTIGVNTCRDYLRKRSSRATLHQVWQAIQSFAAHPPGPEESAIHNESRAQLWDLVDQLNEKHRLVVILRLVNDLSIQEISQILDVNEKTVYSRLYDAFKNLRRRMKASPEFEVYLNEFQS